MRLTINEIKRSKHFYRDGFRRTVLALAVSYAIMVVLIVAILYTKLTLKAPDYYATNSAGFITPLKAMDHPNTSSKALLKPDPPEEANKKQVNV